MAEPTIIDIRKLPDFWRLSATLRNQILLLPSFPEQFSWLNRFLEDPALAVSVHEILINLQKLQKEVD